MTSEDFFRKICTSHFIVTFVCERELETEQRLQYIDPTHMAISIVSFSFSWCSTGGPGAHSAVFLYRIFSPTGLVPKLHRGSRGPLRPGVAFPTTSCLYHIWSPTIWLPVLTELYNSSSPTQSSTQSLEWYVWSSSSGNNCHAVQMSLSSGASVYECIMGFFTLSHFVSQARLRDFLSWLPLECVTSFRCITLEWQVWPGRRSKYNSTLTYQNWSHNSGFVSI